MKTKIKIALAIIGIALLPIIPSEIHQILTATKKVIIINPITPVRAETTSLPPATIDICTLKDVICEHEAQKYEFEAEVSAYNAEEAQTDDSPFIMANNQKVHEKAVANNCLPFGTKIEIEGMGEYIVSDRMNTRYGCQNFDVFMWDKNEALAFGRQAKNYRIIQ